MAGDVREFAAVHDLDRVPPEISTSNRAVVWNLENRDGKRTKVPYISRRPAERASVNDPNTWGTFAEARAAVEDGNADGVGVVLGDGLVGIDLDGCRDPDTGAIDPMARAMIDFLASYTEVTPSGSGFTFFFGVCFPRMDGARATSSCTTAVGTSP
jgi:primase-polymerase (primpol)-like protein